MSPERRPRRAWWVSLAGWFLIESLLQAAGAHRGAFMPLLYLWAHLVAGLAGPGPTFAVLGLSIAAEGVRAGLGGPWLDVLVHAGFLLLFASTAAGVLRLEVLRLRNRTRSELDQRVQRLEEEARDYRLVGALLNSALPERTADERDRVRREGSVAALRRSMQPLLEVQRRSLQADAVRVFFHGDDNRLEHKASAPDADGVRTSRFAPAGALAAVLKTDRSIQIHPRRSGPNLGYGVKPGTFLGLPIRVNRIPVGVVVAERSSEERFDEEAEALLALAAEHLAEAIEVERLLGTMDRLKFEQQRFIEAFNLLADARTTEQTSARLVQAARRVVDHEVIAVALLEPDGTRFRVAAMDAPADVEPKLADLTTDHDGANLISSAVKHAQVLPVVPLSDGVEQSHRVFGRSTPLSLRSVKVLPILHHGHALGALVVGTQRRNREPTRDEVRVLSVVVSQSAMSLTNARMFEEVERRATTDGLTGLINHRRFQELLDEALARSIRFERPLAVMMIDADHFKSINDTFGHPVGDLVLEKIARWLQEEARQTDVVARYGGEEFVLVLEGTDAEGARVVAERIREKVEGGRIEGDFGKLGVTVSIGVSLLVPPLSRGEGPDKAKLLDRADKALYRAKQRGRNRVEVAPDPRCVSSPASDKSRRADPQAQS